MKVLVSPPSSSVCEHRRLPLDLTTASPTSDNHDHAAADRTVSEQVPLDLLTGASSCSSHNDDAAELSVSNREQASEQPQASLHLLQQPQEKVVPGELVPYAAWNRWFNDLIVMLGGWQKVEGDWVRPGSNELTRENIGYGSLNASQYRAQYGRANPVLVDQVIRKANISKSDRFIDIGSGIGHVVMQVACTVGCPSAGIEVVAGRHAAALQLYEHFGMFLETTGACSGDVSLKLGDFVDPKHRDFILNSGQDRTSVFFVNNAQGTFGSRCVESGSNTLDFYVSNLAKLTKVGSRIISFDPLLEFESTEHKDCFTKETIQVGPGGTCWTEKSNTPLQLYIYTKRFDHWTCKTCGIVHHHLVTIQDGNLYPVYECICEEDPAGKKRSYDLRNNRKRKKSRPLLE